MSKKDKSVVIIIAILIGMLIIEIVHYTWYAFSYNDKINHVEDRVITVENRLDKVEDRVDKIEKGL